jgi:hypothetical protein
MLQQLKWETLESRRTKIQLTMFYKIVNNFVDIPADHYLTPSKNRTITTHSKKKLQKFPTLVVATSHWHYWLWYNCLWCILQLFVVSFLISVLTVCGGGFILMLIQLPSERTPTSSSRHYKIFRRWSKSWSILEPSHWQNNKESRWLVSKESSVRCYAFR